MQTVSIVKDIIISLATIVAMCTAIYGVRAWRRELKGKTEYEIARRILRSIYKVRMEIHALRNPFISAGEMVTALKEQGKELNLTPGATNTDDGTTAAYIRRWKFVTDAIIDMQTDFFEGQVLWGDKMQEIAKPFIKCVNTVGVYLSQHINRKNPPRASDYENKIEDAIYGVDLIDGPVETQYGAEFRKTVETAEAFLRQHLHS